MEYKNIIPVLSLIGTIITNIILWKMTKRKLKESKKQFNRTLKSQQSKIYKELITSEHIKTYNSLRDAMIAVLNSSIQLTYNVACGGEDRGEEQLLAREYKRYSSEFHSKIMWMKLTVRPDEIDFLQKIDDYDGDIYKFTKKILDAREGETIDVGVDRINHPFEKNCQGYLEQEWKIIQNEARALYCKKSIK